MAAIAAYSFSHKSLRLISKEKENGLDRTPVDKLKVTKRVAYVFGDERNLHLSLYALHDCRITPNVG